MNIKGFHKPRITDVTVDVDANISINGTLCIPDNAKGIVVFAHGSGSGRFSPRNRFVAEMLHHGQLATLLIDLLTPEEEQVDLQTRHLRFDIGLLTKRVCGATKWLKENDQTCKLPIAYFGASTGAAAALSAAGQIGEDIYAVVSRGGRPDLAEACLGEVKSPTLLIVGGDDPIVIELNKMAIAKLNCEKELVIIPGATHLFEEPGKLEIVAETARKWFVRYFEREEVV
ncbi:MAG: alpha/beta hydrolase [Planctomycetes bacterium]|nr:alpha/beta hydrolase [Planctomycetota bacterium]